ncbi:hypothetical protein HPB47_001060 [Ixodes persulcatus]|uniref:Uncharacterized protein n=1 Tax=Ixodes persulcatus TaxID=34615 RepID=A0AC60PQE5_IXOPE|nr:hypothetical protein HPB47_001060 [Ixodes persulcatus]
MAESGTHTHAGDPIEANLLKTRQGMKRKAVPVFRLAAVFASSVQVRQLSTFASPNSSSVDSTFFGGSYASWVESSRALDRVSACPSPSPRLLP